MHELLVVMTGPHGSLGLKDVFATQNLADRGDVGVAQPHGNEREKGFLVAAVKVHHAVFGEQVLVGHGVLVIGTQVGDALRTGKLLQTRVARGTHKGVGFANALTRRAETSERAVTLRRSGHGRRSAVGGEV